MCVGCDWMRSQGSPQTSIVVMRSREQHKQIILKLIFVIFQLDIFLTTLGHFRMASSKHTLRHLFDNLSCFGKMHPVAASRITELVPNIENIHQL